MKYSITLEVENAHTCEGSPCWDAACVTCQVRKIADHLTSGGVRVVGKSITAVADPVPAANVEEPPVRKRGRS